MADLIYKKELEYAFNMWLKKHNFSQEVELATDFAFSESENKIYLGLFIPDYAEQVWHNDLKKWGLERDYGTFVSCFLHELGHAHTLDDFYGIRYTLNNIAKTIIKIMPCGKLRNHLYFSLPIEKSATMWAINYMNLHPRVCENLRKMSIKEVETFLEMNGVVDL